MAEAIHIAAPYQHQVVHTLSTHLKVEEDVVRSWMNEDDAISWEDFWQFRNVMRVYPSTRSLAKTAELFWDDSMMQKIGLTRSFYQKFFSETLAASANGDGKDTAVIDSEKEAAALDTALQVYIAKTRPPIIGRAKEEILKEIRAVNDNTTRFKPNNYRRVDVIDLDVLADISQIVFRRLTKLSRSQLLSLKHANLADAQKLLGPISHDQLMAIQALSEENIKTFSGLSPTLVEDIDPQAEKTESDVLVSVEISSGMAIDPIADLIYNEFERALTRPDRVSSGPGRYFHAVFKNMRAFQKHPGGGVIVSIEIKSGVHELILANRHAYLRYQLKSGVNASGQREHTILISKVEASEYGLPPLTGKEEMKTLAGVITITERSDGGSTLRMDVIGNPNMTFVPDRLVKGKFRDQFVRLTLDISIYLATTKYVDQCLNIEDQSPTICAAK